MQEALGGWRRSGHGCHRGGLNLGDCCSDGLALARTPPPLPLKGEDFNHTDRQVTL